MIYRADRGGNDLDVLLGCQNKYEQNNERGQREVLQVNLSRPVPRGTLWTIGGLTAHCRQYPLRSYRAVMVTQEITY